MSFTEIGLRLLLSSVLLLAGGLAWRLANRWLLDRANRRGAVPPTPGITTVMYFTMPACAPCKTMQRPALEQVQQALGGRLQVVEVDASAQPEIASQWGVLSVPTTFILDASGRPRHVNHGPASVAKLLRQIEQSA